MKKAVVLAAVMVMGLSFAGCDACKENALTKIGDSLATFGKSGIDKDKVMAERIAARASKCAESKAGEMKKKMGF